jgi:RNA polymerase sigma factor (sigma-70 family)
MIDISIRNIIKMKGSTMAEMSDELHARIHAVAAQSVQKYARGILTTDELAEQIYQKYQRLSRGSELPSQPVLTRIAQRVCSRALYAAWKSPLSEVRNYAFDNLRHYLKMLLHNSGYATDLQQYAFADEDVLHQTLEELYLAVVRNPRAGPDDPAAFLKWAQVALMRHAREYIQKNRQNRSESLDARQETFAEQFVDEYNTDPQKNVLHQELHQVLKDAILLIRNPRYRMVLLYTYLAEVDEHELAKKLQVDVQDIYMWRYRALQALRKNKDVLLILKMWRE